MSLTRVKYPVKDSCYTQAYVITQAVQRVSSLAAVHADTETDSPRQQATAANSMHFFSLLTLPGSPSFLVQGLKPHASNACSDCLHVDREEGSPPAGHVGLRDDEAGEEVEDCDHVGGAHRRNLQVGGQGHRYHPCREHSNTIECNYFGTVDQY